MKTNITISSSVNIFHAGFCIIFVSLNDLNSIGKLDMKFSHSHVLWCPSLHLVTKWKHSGQSLHSLLTPYLGLYIPVMNNNLLLFIKWYNISHIYLFLQCRHAFLFPSYDQSREQELAGSNYLLRIRNSNCEFCHCSDKVGTIRKDGSGESECISCLVYNIDSSSWSVHKGRAGLCCDVTFLLSTPLFLNQN